MIVYSGWGWLALVLWFGILVPFRLAVAEKIGHPVSSAPLLATASSALLALIVWLLGRRMNRRPLLVAEWSRSQGTFERPVSRHTLWFIPMEYWGPILGLATVAMDVYFRGTGPN